MPEIADSKQRLEFDILHPGDRIDITTGEGEEAWHYDFQVDQAAYWPIGTFRAISPSGDEATANGFALHGCGRWTTRRENPVQSQERGFTPYYEGLIVGSFMLGKMSGEKDRAVFDRQRIRGITHAPYRINQLFLALAANAGRTSVKQAVEFVRDAQQPMSEIEIRATLRDLVKRGLAEEHKGRALTYELVAS
ncbi:hypothetical protein KDA23_01470 [Candidatus Saccharibacteria bacterium]|nr:hypothetical protein [Candidatus Saccharibacteria bacterium]